MVPFYGTIVACHHAAFIYYFLTLATTFLEL